MFSIFGLARKWVSFGIVDSNFILAVKTNSVAFIGARVRDNQNFFLNLSYLH